MGFCWLPILIAKNHLNWGYFSQNHHLTKVISMGQKCRGQLITQIGAEMERCCIGKLKNGPPLAWLLLLFPAAIFVVNTICTEMKWLPVL